MIFKGKKKLYNGFINQFVIYFGEIICTLKSILDTLDLIDNLLHIFYKKNLLHKYPYTKFLLNPLLNNRKQKHTEGKKFSSSSLPTCSSIN